MTSGQRERKDSGGEKDLKAAGERSQGTMKKSVQNFCEEIGSMKRNSVQLFSRACIHDLRILVELGSCKKSHLNKANEDDLDGLPLRDSYMLTSSKLKDWDKMEDSASVGGHKIMSDGSSSDED
ncbi:hypothetical protein KSP40_PGU005108 [Platanthera guangdongensis]|uniref:Uncharacterized protein n=1 Tax=Platanthera guangdongensis TaxID=2320717 RepID=A0ABR2MKJ9_9ASPA